MGPDFNHIASDNLPTPGRWGMAARGFLCQNIANGCAFGGFSLALVPLRDHFNVGTGTVSLGISLAMLMSGLLSPWVGTLIGRIGLRSTMMAGALLTVAGYVALAFAPTIYWALAAYALLIGVGVAMCGSLTSNVLVNIWFQPSPGRAVGLINMSVLLALVPLFMGKVLDILGLRGFYLTFAAISALLFPIIWGVADRQRVPHANLGQAKASQVGMPTNLLRRPSFWTLALGGGALTAVSVVTLSHIIAVVFEAGRPIGDGMLLASVRGGAAIAGSLLCGILCDRIGAARTLALIGVCFSASWVVLITTTQTVPLALAAVALGIGAGGAYGAINVLASILYGPASLPRALGLWAALILPMTFLLPPSVGLLHDRAAGYGPAGLLMSIMCTAAAIAFYILGRVMRRQPTVPQAEALQPGQ